MNDEFDHACEEAHELFIETITKENCNVVNEQAFAEIKIGIKPHKIRFKLDTGAPENKI